MSAIEDKYAAMGGATGSLGAALGAEVAAPDGFGQLREFQHGTIYWSPASGAHALHADLRDAYRRAGAGAGTLGYPITDDTSSSDGTRYALLQGGALQLGGHGTHLLPARRGHLWAHALPVVGASGTGIHVSWIGPPSWTYSARGFWVQRRLFEPGPDDLKQCEHLDAAAIAAARGAGEASLSMGHLLVQSGLWPYRPSPQVPPRPCDVFRLELAEPQSVVGVTVAGATGPALLARAPLPVDAFMFGLRNGKVVAGPIHAPRGVLRGPVLDAIVVYAIGEVAIQFCVRDARAVAAAERAWSRVPYLVEGLQLPLTTLDPTITDEYATAAARVPPRTISSSDFAQVADPLRKSLPATASPRPIDRIALWRDGGSTGGAAEEMAVLDPLRISLLHPIWRRALGMAIFDQRGLSPGQSYEYRVTGVFPVEDLDDAVYGFHTVPSQTQVPVEFFLGPLRLRVPQPSRVVRTTPSDPANLVCRRGLVLQPWTGGFAPLGIVADLLGAASCVIDFPAPVSTLVVETAPGQPLSYATSAAGGAAGARQPLASGDAVTLAFAAPIDQLLLYGKGTLLTIRVSSGARGLVPVSVTLPPVLLADTPLPPPPTTADLANLQSLAPSSSPEVPAARHAIGFEVRWQPPPTGDAWPVAEPAAAPLEATLFQIQHRNLDAHTDWEDVLDGDNWIFGSRAAPPAAAIRPGSDLLELYPEQRAPDPVPFLLWRDAFSVDLPGHPARRPAPPPNTHHKYRVRSVDTIGRPSATWTETPKLRLEKHLPPPLPAAWESGWAFASPTATVPLAREPQPTGVFAKILQAGGDDLAAELASATDLSAAERAALSSMTGNAIILRWGWHADQRDLDPYAREFRLYETVPLDAIPGTLTSWDPLPGGWRLHLQLARKVAADAARGLYLEAGYAFHVTTHPAGHDIAVDVAVAVPNADGSLPAPTAGAVRLPVRMSSALRRPARWDRRVGTVAIDPTVEQYHYIFTNLLHLSATQARDTVWVGVSAADDQPYIADERAAIDPAHAHVGNESSIVTVVCGARFDGRPQLTDTPPLAAVPTTVTPEPVGRPVVFELDLTGALPPGALAAGDLVAPERCSAGDVIGAYFLDGADLRSRKVARRVGEPADEPASFFSALASSDRAAIGAALGGRDIESVDGRYLVWLAAMHPDRDRLFKPALTRSVPFGPFKETLPVSGGRWIYRLRKANASGQLSDGAAYARLIVRVPSTSPGAAPEKESVTLEADAVRLRLRAPSSLGHLLLFSRPLTGAAPTVTGELLRLSNRDDLYPAHIDRMIFLRTSDGLLQPQVKSLDDSDVVPSDDGFRHAELRFAGPPGQVLQVWACSLTRDRVPSRVVGPFRLTMPYPGGSHG